MQLTESRIMNMRLTQSQQAIGAKLQFMLA